MARDYTAGPTSPRRADTPEPASIQGWRNDGVHLLDEGGAISEQVFLSYLSISLTPFIQSIIIA